MTTQFGTLFQVLDLAIEYKLWPEKKPSEVFKLILYVHNRGWLYTPVVDTKVQAVICAYRIPEVNPDNLVKIPVAEEGNILYVPFAISLGSDNLFSVIRETLRDFLDDNPDIVELVLEKKGKTVRFNLGDRNGIEKLRAAQPA